jgi:hypothetical protein
MASVVEPSLDPEEIDDSMAQYADGFTVPEAVRSLGIGVRDLVWLAWGHTMNAHFTGLGLRDRARVLVFYLDQAHDNSYRIMPLPYQALLDEDADCDDEFEAIRRKLVTKLRDRAVKCVDMGDDKEAELRAELSKLFGATMGGTSVDGSCFLGTAPIEVHMHGYHTLGGFVHNWWNTHGLYKKVMEDAVAKVEAVALGSLGSDIGSHVVRSMVNDQRRRMGYGGVEYDSAM